MADTETLKRAPTIEEALIAAGRNGLTMAELRKACELSDGTSRRKVKALEEEGKLHRVPRVNGWCIVWGRPGSEPLRVRPDNGEVERPMSARRIKSRERDMVVAELLRKAGAEGMSLPDIARAIGANDMRSDGFSQLTYLSLRRLATGRQAEKIIRWRLKPDSDAAQD